MRQKPNLRILIANPRGFCAGVVRAIEALDQALNRFGPPIFVRHEIVHNPYVVDGFRERGAVFVDDLSQVPGGARVMLSAHGVSPEVTAEARRRGLRFVDTTCPLVSKVHREVEHHAARERTVIVVGHSDHPEVIGTAGHAAGRPSHVLSSVAEVRALPPDPTHTYAYVTQTTLAVDETAEIITALGKKFPGIVGPARDDICYATTNRQAAVKAIAPRCDAFLIIGGRHSSNSKRLVEAAQRAGCDRAWLIETPDEIDCDLLEGCATVGISSGASTPEVLVEQALARLATRFIPTIETIGEPESVAFRSASLEALA